MRSMVISIPTPFSRSNAYFLHHVAILVVLCMTVSASTCMIINLKQLKIPIGSSDVRKQTMFSQVETPIGKNVGSVAVNLNLSSENPGNATVLFYTYEMRDQYGQNGDPKTFCCTKAQQAAGECTLGQVVVHNEKPKKFPLGRHLIALRGASSVTNVSFSSPNVSSTSTYYVAIVNCEGSGTGQLFANGQIIFQNPFGYLPGASLGLWYYYGLQAIAYLIVSLIFGTGMLICRAQLKKFHIILFGLLILGTVQTLFWYLYELQRNITGVQSEATVVLVFAIIFRLVFGTGLRLLVLVLCKGLGFVKVNLSSLKYWELGISVTFFIASLVYGIVEAVTASRASSDTHPMTNIPMRIALYCIYICDAVFFVRARYNIRCTKEILSRLRQALKLSIFKELSNVMLACSIVWGITCIQELYSPQQFELIWFDTWIWISMYHFSFFILTTIISLYWRPTKDRSRYYENPESLFVKARVVGDLSLQIEEDPLGTSEWINKDI